MAAYLDIVEHHVHRYLYTEQPQSEAVPSLPISLYSSRPQRKSISHRQPVPQLPNDIERNEKSNIQSRIILYAVCECTPRKLQSMVSYETLLPSKKEGGAGGYQTFGSRGCALKILSESCINLHNRFQFRC
ncbi:hypothetical protein ACHQM5_026383 [Ranunculus cassubicifolius]